MVMMMMIEMMFEMMINRIMMVVVVSLLHIYIESANDDNHKVLDYSKSYIAALIDDVKHIDAISD
jgi:hypothetical protein